MSELVPYTQPARNVGLIESFRLAREERQANANLERLTRDSALSEVAAQHGAMRRANDLRRAHLESVLAIHLVEERTHYGIDATTRCYDHAVEAVGGDRGKATYIEPLLSRGAERIKSLI